ncbi:MAG TPA: ABC transporter transmembrane domain-containing protein, partial [Candidatus Saccharimonadales bacterium]|nr:ABC transporter transmembrane domain-containing protein [Candidatus Saccharimonadales bacterium]
MDTPHDKVSAWDICKFYFAASFKHRKLAWMTLFHVAGSILLGVLVPFAASLVLAALAQGKDVTSPLFLLAAVSLGGVICNRLGFGAMMAMQANAMSDLHRLCFNRLMQRSVGFHADRVSGKLVSDAIDFINSYGMLTSALFLNTVGFLVSILAGIIILLVISWPLGLFVSAIVMVTLVWAGSESRKRAHLRNERLKNTKKLTAHLSDCIVNAPTVKTFAHEAYEKQRNAELNHKLRELRIRDWRRAGNSGSNRIGALLAM